MGRFPHKSTWKQKRIGEPETVQEEERPSLELDIRETLSKIKRFTLILIALLVIPVIITLFIWGALYIFMPFICLAATFIAVFFIYFPASDAMKKITEKGK